MHAWGCHLGCGSAGGCVGSPELPVPAHSHHHQQVPQDGHQDNCRDEGEQYDLLCYAEALTRTWGGGSRNKKRKDTSAHQSLGTAEQKAAGVCLWLGIAAATKQEAAWHFYNYLVKRRKEVKRLGACKTGGQQPTCNECRSVPQKINYYKITEPFFPFRLFLLTYPEAKAPQPCTPVFPRYIAAVRRGACSQHHVGLEVSWH